MPRNWSCRKIFACCEIFTGCIVHPAKFPSCCHCSSCSTVHHFATIHLYCCFTLFLFCYNFLFLPILSLVITFDFGSFCNFAWLGQYISSYTIIKDNFLLINKIGGNLSAVPLLFFFLHFPSFSLPFSAAKHPLRMTTQGMVG